MTEASDDGHAIKLANESYRWYRDRAIACRRGYQIQERVTLVVAAAIPASAVLTHNDARIPAILGALVVILPGLRAIFHWQENYLRFSGAREAVKTQRRLYETGAAPYDDPTTRDRELTREITRIEQEEAAGWIKVAAEHPKP
ncbi:DUF4231 domain-containing protein [Kribbella sp. NPDC006257]|uniref:DUF4231 domain-containing protein n=1 Tax=Kribbella sp. NPDC006257 TaxID=3156738 RepID=UPI0033A5047D